MWRKGSGWSHWSGNMRKHTRGKKERRRKAGARQRNGETKGPQPRIPPSSSQITLLKVADSDGRSLTRARAYSIYYFIKSFTIHRKNSRPDPQARITVVRSRASIGSRVFAVTPTHPSRSLRIIADNFLALPAIPCRLEITTLGTRRQWGKLRLMALTNRARANGDGICEHQRDIFNFSAKYRQTKRRDVSFDVSLQDFQRYTCATLMTREGSETVQNDSEM